MSRLTNYLNEDTRQILFDSLEKIENKCGPYLKEARKRSFRMYSGRKGQGDKILIEKTVRKDRKPKDTPIEIHNRLDDMFEKETGIRLRSNSIFCTMDYVEARKYGPPFMIFPIGNDYQLWYNENVTDLWSKISLLMVPGFNTIDDKSLEWLTKRYKKGFPTEKIEIMLHCDKYLGINTQWISQNWLDNHFNEWLKG